MGECVKREPPTAELSIKTAAPMLHDKTVELYKQQWKIIDQKMVTFVEIQKLFRFQVTCLKSGESSAILPSSVLAAYESVTESEV